MPFFNRFHEDILQNYLPFFQRKLKLSKKILFPKQGKVYIILAGYVGVYEHHHYNIPNIVSFYQEGDIIGCEEKDNNLSCKVNIWFVCNSDVEYICLGKSKFNEMWKK